MVTEVNGLTPRIGTADQKRAAKRAQGAPEEERRVDSDAYRWTEDVGWTRECTERPKGQKGNSEETQRNALLDVRAVEDNSNEWENVLLAQKSGKQRGITGSGVVHNRAQGSGAAHNQAQRSGSA
jgi:hypothetical protein